MADTLPRLSVGGIALEYRQIPGDQAKPTLVLLHEGLGCVALWRDFPEMLCRATEHPVFVYSRAGYGGSDPVQLPRPLDYMSIEARDVLPRLLACAGIGPHVLIGHSDGATISLIHAGTTKSDELRGVIAIAPHTFAETMGIDSIAAVNVAFSSGGLRDRLRKYHGANVDCAFRGWCDSWLNPRFLDWSVEREILSIEVPILQIQGADDEYGSVAQLRRIEKATKGEVETLLLDDCGHAPHAEQPAHTMKAISRFVQRVVE